MNYHLPAVLWLLLGVPVAAPFFLRKKWDLGLCLLPFGGSLALVTPWLVSALFGTAIAGWSWAMQAAVAAVVLGAIVELVFRRDEPPVVQPPHPPRRDPLQLGLTAGCLIGIAIVAWSNFISGLTFCRGYPPFLWDGYAIWLLRAKLLAGGAVYPSEVGVDGALLDYPLVVPALFAWFKRVGGLDLLQLSSVTGITAAVLPLAAWAGTFRRIGPGFAGMVALSPFAMERLLSYHFGAYADPMLTMAGLYGLALCMIAVRDRDSGYALAGGLAFAVTVATKNEGALWILCSGVLIGLYGLDTGLGLRKSATVVLRCVGLAVIFFLAWWLACKRLHITNDLVTGWSTAVVAVRIHRVVTAVGGELARRPHLLLWLPAVVAMVVLARGQWYCRVRRVGVLLSGPVLYVVGMILTYLGTPNDLEWHMGSSLGRVMYLVSPSILMLMLFARTAEPRQRG